MALDRKAAEAAIQTHLAGPLGVSVQDAAWGVHETVTANMAQAASIHAIERGLDATRFAMLPIGGAGPVHACSMAAKMNIDRLVCPVGAGVASAIGMLAAPISFEVGRAAPTRLDALDTDEALALLEDMRGETQNLVASAGVDEADNSFKASAMMRYVGQGYEIEAAFQPDDLARDGSKVLADAFATAYSARYGRVEAMPPEILSWRVVGAGPRPALGAAIGGGDAVEAGDPASTGARPVFFGESYIDTPIYRRSTLAAGQRIRGPAIIEEDESTLVLPPSFALQVDQALNLIIEHGDRL